MKACETLALSTESLPSNACLWLQPELITQHFGSTTRTQAWKIISGFPRILCILYGWRENRKLNLRRKSFVRPVERTPTWRKWVRASSHVRSWQAADGAQNRRTSHDLHGIYFRVPAFCIKGTIGSVLNSVWNHETVTCLTTGTDIKGIRNTRLITLFI